VGGAWWCDGFVGVRSYFCADFYDFLGDGEVCFLLGFLRKRVVVVVVWWSTSGKKCGKCGERMRIFQEREIGTFGSFIFPQVWAASPIRDWIG
jgi:hypothetical protein